MAIAPANNMTDVDYELIQKDLTLDELNAITGTKEHILRARRKEASKRLLKYVERNMYVLSNNGLEALKQIIVKEQVRRKSEGL